VLLFVFCGGGTTFILCCGGYFCVVRRIRSVAKEALFKDARGVLSVVF